MSRFSFQFAWLKGSQNPVADALSRQPVGMYTTTVIDARLVGIWKRIQAAAADDPEYCALTAKVRDGGMTGWKLWEGLVVDEQGCIVVPDDSALRTLLLSENHDPGYAGHFGAEKHRPWSSGIGSRRV